MKDELYNQIIEHIRDEIADVERYNDLADECAGYAHAVIRNIAKDEESHARYLSSVLKDNGRAMPADVWQAYSAMEASFRQASNR